MIVMHQLSCHSTQKETPTIQFSLEVGQFHQCLERIIENKISGCDRFDCMYLMRAHLCREEGVNEPNLGLLYIPLEQIERILLCCQILHDWSLEIVVRKALQKKLLKSGEYSDVESKDIFNTLGLIQAYMCCGEFQQADAELVKAFLTRPLEPRFDYMDSKLDDFFSRHCYQGRDLILNDLRLTPMTTEHLHGFAWQYTDPSIRELCNLPDFTSNEQWLDWLHDYTNAPDQHLFAIVHKSWGFIGSVCLEMDDDIGFFYYWLGMDFQGHGFGPEAGEILLRLGHIYHGLKSCYAKVFKHNEISQKGIGKLGFKQLPYSFADPDDHEFLYYLGAEKTAPRQFSEAQRIFMKFDNGRHLVPWNLGEFYS